VPPPQLNYFSSQAIVNLGIVLRKQGQPDKALRHYQSGLKYYQKHGMLYEIGQVKTNIAAAYSQMEDWGKVSACYEEALEILEKLGESELANEIRNMDVVRADTEINCE
jgi:tetratricopeptide (TPR) repeat protein